MHHLLITSILCALIRIVSTYDDHKINEAIKLITKKNNVVIKMVEKGDPLEYPGNKYVTLEKISRKWEKYYSCLRKKYEHEAERKPTIVQILEGQYTLLKCPICSRPFEKYQNLEWKFKPLNHDINDPDEPEVLDLPPQMIYSRKKSLKIYNAIVDYSGLYVCYHWSNPVSVYILEVVRSDNITLIEDNTSTDDKISITEDKTLEIYYKFSKWTDCSECNAVGKKYKYGICMAKISAPPVNAKYKRSKKSRRKVENTEKGHQSNKTSSTTHRPHTQNEIRIAQEVINKFGTGIPCLSKLMPDSFTPLIQKSNITFVAISQYCKVPCEKDDIFEVVDNTGRVIEEVNNSAGIYSRYQQLPSVPPEVGRTTITADFGKDIVLQCPGNLQTNTPVKWMIDGLMLIPELISRESSGRINIDVLSKLHINNVRLKDSHVYSCWQRDKLAGTISVQVLKHLNIVPNHHVLLVSMFLIIIVFIRIGSKILVRELRLRKNSKLTT